LDIAFGTDANGDGQPEMYVTNEGTGTVLRYAGPLTAPAATLPVTVLDVVTQTYNSPNVPKQIKDNQTVTSTLTVSDPGTVFDVNVRVNITHQRDQDLDVFLIAPDGTRVELFSDVGGNGQNFTNTMLDDEASAAITAGSAPFTGTYRPEGPLSALDGKSVTGTWTLEITDDQKSKTGTLNSWSLTITRGVGPAPLSADTAGPGTTAPALSESQVAPLLAEALARWQAAGVDISRLSNVRVEVVNLPGSALGMAAGN